MKKPTLESGSNKAWETPADDRWPATLGGWIVHVPGAHPMWSYYLVSVVHLRPMEDREVDLQFIGATHEIGVLALDPDHTPDPDDPETFKHLEPPNLIQQLGGLIDSQALSITRQLVTAFVYKELSPDTDHRSCQKAWIDARVSYWRGQQ